MYNETAIHAEMCNTDVTHDILMIYIGVLTCDICVRHLCMCDIFLSTLKRVTFVLQII